MFVAVDKDGNRVYASADTDRSIDYFCPVCGGKVRLRSWKTENLNVPHFAHVNKNECTDDFTADMSEWHRAWQELFPIKNREVVITHGEEKHRADVLCYGTVIEFQHSTISESEFWRRNDFYTSAGYKVVWVFDLTDMKLSDKDFVAARLYYRIKGLGRSWVWKHPWRMLSSFYPQKEKDISVFFQFEELDEDKICSRIEQIVWAYGNFTPWSDERFVPWGRFISSFRIRDKVQLLDWLKSRWLNSGVDNGDGVNPIMDSWTSNNSVVDGWKYGDSLWSNKWKSYFPNSCVNVTVECTDCDYIRQGAEKPIERIHLLDVYEDGVAIFFHKGAIWKDEFFERNNALLCNELRFRCKPYVNHVAWVFDVQKEFERGFLKYESRDDNRLFLKWENPERIIGFANSVSGSLENVSIWLAWDDDGERLSRIKSWDSGFERIRLENSVICFGDDIEVKRFSCTEEEWERRELGAFVERYEPYKLLLAGKKGGRKWQYICPRTNQFGIKIFGDDGCKYCRYCLAIECTGSKQWQVYCKFPNAINDLDGVHDGYECSGVKLWCDFEYVADGWNYGDSFWSDKWKGRFPKSCANVTVECTDYDCIRQGADKPINKKHLLDVYENGTAVFFHKGSISKEEFFERNNVLLCHDSRFRCAPYVNHVAWVFDVQEVFERGFLKYESRDDNRLFLKWENPERVIGFAKSVSGSLENVSIWLAEADGDDYGGEYLTRIKSWERGFERIRLESRAIHLNDAIDIARFSFTEEEWERRELRAFVEQYEPYKLLLFGKKGGRKWQYICPRTNQFGIKIFGDDGCKYCRYCLAIECTGSKQWQVYCKFPNAINDLDGVHDGYECSGVKLWCDFE